ncbi:hypothetical protein CMQ_2363 [Grosmannia clavigera kw1407]|uniref:WW domain-containing protein n=1 Tax=Grosmannia clavigera (strain kw1407 / UAMH 11150) TaxID=655863 RepID=F0XJP2_GROCL|nr:uncharacterized protein CMQ_2363 [Grosmannia clavigera kw1407]EFX02314.1 hypothetical protein CMQ_2363 [Grosmannia clavigera kw1407]
MASLPEGWESDYDGARWFFRYKPTGTIQYHFPKPGDEFPEFHDNFGPIQQSYEPIPEELLESERQIRCQTATGVPAAGSGSVKRRKDSSAASATLGGGDFIGTSFELFGYYGPGSYNDMNPEHEDWEDETGSKQDSRPGALTDGELHGTSISNMGTPSSVFSGVTSEAVEVLPVPSTAAAVEVHELPDSAALGGLHYASDPVGYVSELASDMTALCMEAFNPPPVELPGIEVYSLGADPAASHSMPVELPNDPKLPSVPSVPSIPSPVQSIPQPVEPPQTHVEPLVSASFASQTSTQQAQQQQKPAQDTSAKSYRAFCTSTVSSEEDSARRFSVTSGIENIERGFNKEKLHEEYRVVGPTKELTDVPLALQPPQKSPTKLMESSQDSSESSLADPATLEVAAVTSAPVQHKRHGEQPGYLSDVPSALRPAQGRLISPPAAQTSDTDLTAIPAALRPAGIPGPVPAEALVNDGQNSGTTQPHTHSLLIDSGTLRIPDGAPPIAILDVDEVITSVSSESTEPELIPRPLRLVRQGSPAIPSPETAEAKKVVDFESALELPWTQAQKLQPRRPVSTFGIMSISTAMPAPLKTDSRFPPVPPLFGIMIPTSQPSSLGDAGSSLQPERRASTPATTIATQRRSTPPVMTAPVMALDHPVPSHATQGSHDPVEQCIASSDLVAPLSKIFSSTTSPPVENFTQKTTPPGRTFGRPFTAEAVQPGPDPAQNHPSPPAANMADIPHSDISTQPPIVSGAAGRDGCPSCDSYPTTIKHSTSSEPDVCP